LVQYSVLGKFAILLTISTTAGALPPTRLPALEGIASIESLGWIPSGEPDRETSA